MRVLRPNDVALPDHGLGSNGLDTGMPYAAALHEERLAKVLTVAYMAACGAGCLALRAHVDHAIAYDDREMPDGPRDRGEFVALIRELDALGLLDALPIPT
jgi:hypothetical protein